MRENAAFYGEHDEGPTVSEILARLGGLTGSSECAVELVEAADYVEQVCGPQAAITQMPAWVN